jgi:PKD repeat protein
MDSYNTGPIRLAMADAVADGTVIMNSVMDEPQIKDWGGVMTKPLLDQMAAYVKAIFPTLAVGVVARWDWRSGERYQVIDAVLAQYQWSKGSVTAYRDNVLARAAIDGISVIFSLNILDGGIMNFQTNECPIPLTGGYGTKVPNCRMTPDQVRDWGRLLGTAGCALTMWKYDAAFMGNAANQQAFRDVAATLAATPGRPCRRTEGGSPPPPPPGNAPPVAAFTPPSCTAGVPCEFTDESRDDDGTIAARSWSFGNGETATGATPATTFATAGAYDVLLQVTDDDGATDAVTRSVSVASAETPPLTAAFSVPSCVAGSPCRFTDASHGGDGTIAVREWDFAGEATSTEPSPTHAFQSAGDHGVTLTVTDGTGATDALTRTVTVRAANVAPVAGFTAPTCTAGSACQFTDASHDDDGSIASRSWSFANGQTSTAANPSVTYAAAGSYDVRLEVTDDDGATDAVTRAVTVEPAPIPPPNADFTFTCSGLVCSFTDRSTDPENRITGRSWSFGDGWTSTAVNPQRTYTNPGTYDVTLTLTYSGGTDQHTASVTVSAPTQPPPQPGGIVLTASGSSDATNLYATLKWTGAIGSRVQVFRNAKLWSSTENDGQYVNIIKRPGLASYTYQVCQPNSTICSSTVTVTFR